MILAMGVGVWVGGLFHLITHAFFKALLFLGSGSVIHAAHHEQEMPQYGGLMRKIPVTGDHVRHRGARDRGLGIAGSGSPGYYSKDMILAARRRVRVAGDERRAVEVRTGCSSSCPAVIAYVTRVLHDALLDADVLRASRATSICTITPTSRRSCGSRWSCWRSLSIIGG